MPRRVGSWRPRESSKPSSPEVHYLLGVAREKNQQLELALACYRQALEVDPAYVDAIVAIGEVLAEMEQPAEALAYIEEQSLGHAEQSGLTSWPGGWR